MLDSVTNLCVRALFLLKGEESGFAQSHTPTAIFGDRFLLVQAVKHSQSSNTKSAANSLGSHANPSHYSSLESVSLRETLATTVLHTHATTKSRALGISDPVLTLFVGERKHGHKSWSLSYQSGLVQLGEHADFGSKQTLIYESVKARL